MVKKIGFWLVWAAFVTYAFLLAPPEQPGTFELIKNLSTGQWTGINPIVIALFNLLGIVPMIYACLMFIDGKQQKVAAWPFSAFSFGVGAFALLPYLALREPNQEFHGKKNLFLKILDSRWLGLLLTIGAGSLFVYGLLGGNWADYIQQFQTNRFVHVMSLDFCLLWLIFPALLGDDMARRGIKSSALFWIVALIPLFGSLAYLCLRPPLPETSAEAFSTERQPAQSRN
jgi:hypothetical protein